MEGLRYTNQPRLHKHHYRQEERTVGVAAQNPYEEREGETSGYASDSLEAPVPSGNFENNLRRNLCDTTGNKFVLNFLTFVKIYRNTDRY